VWLHGVLIGTLIAGSAGAQQQPQIFPNLLYGPSAWSILRFTNPSEIPKSVRINVYRADGSKVDLQPLYTIAARSTVDVRVEGGGSEYQYCWAQVEDVSARRSGPALKIEALVEQVVGDKLEEFPESTAPIYRYDHWLSPSSAVSGEHLFFLNTSDEPVKLEICSVNTFPNCSADGSKAVRITMNAKQSMVFRMGTVRRRFLLIQCHPVVPFVIGLLRSASPITREYSSDSSISFDESGK